MDHWGVVDPEAVQAQFLGPHGEVLHTGLRGDNDACTHQNLQGVRIESNLPSMAGPGAGTLRSRVIF
ncbi:hypothetical protein GCM10010219_65790 [Streptomyces netropsis]|nr:hypothetical protein GCM10010219_65790 [Streptomyces netropsis]